MEGYLAFGMMIVLLAAMALHAYITLEVMKMYPWTRYIIAALLSFYTVQRVFHSITEFLTVA